jgi:deoxyribodipyrimidine photo-lyase
METSVWWVRRDLRLADNQALNTALACAEQVVPVFVLDPVLLDAYQAADKRVAFLLEGLRALDASLKARGSRLIVRSGDPAGALRSVVEETRAGSVFAEEDPWPYARRRDERVAQSVPLHLVGGLTLHPPTAVLKSDGGPYVMFTPFSRVWKSLPLPEANSLLLPPEQLMPPPTIGSLPIPWEPALPASVPFTPGEGEALRRLQVFVEGEEAAIFAYGDRRDRMDLEATSKLSPYLRFGMLSARQAVASVLAAMEAAPDARARKGAETWLNELVWREFYMTILYHFPGVVEQSFRSNLRDVAWANDIDDFAAWCEGRTGYPVVDAAMRQLVHTGWMHNRARMIVASFLVKDLLIDWRWGEQFFMQHLVDGDPAANNGGWQWTAGTGTDAAPYFRIFNPVLQGKKHDPSGRYVRRWVPELDRVPVTRKYIHEPWKMPLDLQRDVGSVIGRDYPAPLVEHAWARERTLAAYAQAKEAGLG